VYGADDELANLIDAVSFRSTRETFLDLESLERLAADEAEMFPAVNEETGYTFIPWARDGMLTELVNRDEHENLRFEFSTDTPASGSGKIVYTQCELVRIGG
jgi:hypothetical protein